MVVEEVERRDGWRDRQGGTERMLIMRLER